MDILFRVASSGRITIVGDMNQCIYEFQGAKYSAMNQFITYYNNMRDGYKRTTDNSKVFGSNMTAHNKLISQHTPPVKPFVKSIYLRMNYRSNHSIVTCCNNIICAGMISHENLGYKIDESINPKSVLANCVVSSTLSASYTSVGVNTLTNSSNTQRHVEFIECIDETFQYEFIYNKIKELLSGSQGINPGNIAVLYRKNTTGKAFRNYLREKSLSKTSPLAQNYSNRSYSSSFRQSEAITKHYPTSHQTNVIYTPEDNEDIKFSYHRHRQPLNRTTKYSYDSDDDSEYDEESDADDDSNLNQDNKPTNMKPQYRVTKTDMQTNKLLSVVRLLLQLHGISHQSTERILLNQKLETFSEHSINSILPDSLRNNLLTREAINETRSIIQSLGSQYGSQIDSFFVILYRVISKGEYPMIDSLSSTSSYASTMDENIDENGLWKKRSLSSSNIISTPLQSNKRQKLNHHQGFDKCEIKKFVQTAKGLKNWYNSLLDIHKAVTRNIGTIASK